MPTDAIETERERSEDVGRLLGRAGGVLSALKRVWHGWSLARQFATCASIVLLPAMTLMGVWVSGRIQEGVTHSAATSAALYMENFVEPLVQDLTHGNALSRPKVEALGSLLKDTTLGLKILTFKIWSKDGVVIASSRPELVDKKFIPSAGLRKAWTGSVVSEFDALKDVENQFEKNTGIPLLEIYMPLRERGSDRIIAVGEFYERAEELKGELDRARLMSWLVVAVVTLSMLSALFAIVRRGSQTIVQQRGRLQQRVDELTRLLAENKNLRHRAQQATARASESNEVYLRRLGADLHDGPAQLISLALLRLDERPSPPAAAGSEPAGVDKTVERIGVRTVLTDALKELRNIAAGLAVPEIEELTLGRSLVSVVERHEQLTRTQVALRCGPLPDLISPALKLCAYRFVQEGLNNAYRHAGGVGQSVDVKQDGGNVVLTVSDAGGGSKKDEDGVSSGLGLRGLADRIESLGGTLQIKKSEGGGMTLTATLPLATGAIKDA